jgi:HSP20 family protein
MALPVRRTSETQAWNSTRELDDLRERMSRLFESSFGGPAGGAWLPAVDIEETDDAFIVEAELPGVGRKDITVELQDNQLTIHGELKERERKGILRRQTRRTGQFDYRVLLPAEVDADNIEADLQEGVLRVEAHKVERAKPRRIEITTH